MSDGDEAERQLYKRIGDAVNQSRADFRPTDCPVCNSPLAQPQGCSQCEGTFSCQNCLWNHQEQTGHRELRIEDQL